MRTLKINFIRILTLGLCSGFFAIGSASLAQSSDFGMSITSVSPSQNATVSGFINVGVETNSLAENLGCMQITFPSADFPYNTWRIDCTPPYSISLDTRRFNGNAVTLFISVSDILGNYSVMNLNLNLANNGQTLSDTILPTATITKPAVASGLYNGQVGSFSFVARNSKFTAVVAPADNSGSVERVVFWAGKKLIDREVAPYSIEIDAAEMAKDDAGGMIIGSNAYDKSGNQTWTWRFHLIIFTDDPALLKLQADADAISSGAGTTTGGTTGSKGKGRRK